MKKLIFTILITISALFAGSQSWEKKLPSEKVENGTVNFFDLQKAFYDYCGEHDVKNGFYTENGKQKELSGYKQFKRWEYIWQSMIDPGSGEFPSIAPQDVINDAKDWKIAAAKSAGNWENLGISDNTRVGRVNCIAFHPDLHDVIYAGTPSGGLWKTSDHGHTWKCLTDDLHGIGVSAIVVIPKLGGDIIYIGTGDRDYGSDIDVAASFSIGVLKSDDGGVTWDTTGLSFESNQREQVTSLKKHPENDEIIYATTTNGFYLTTDGGTNWPNIFSPSLNNEFIDLELSPVSPNVIYLSTRSNANDSTFIYFSDDMGGTWDTIFREKGCRTEIAISEDPDLPKFLYAVVALPKDDGAGLKAVYRIWPFGTSYSMFIDGSTMNILGRTQNGNDIGEGQGDYDLAIAVDPNDGNRVFIGGINTWKWDPDVAFGGILNWDTFDQFALIPAFWKSYQTHSDKHQLIFRPGTSELYECNDGGIFKRHGDRDWEGLSGGMTISQMYRLGLNQKKNENLLTGLQDNGTHKFNGSNWNKIYHSDGMECLIDYDHPSTQYASSQNGSIVRTKIAWTGIDPINITKDAFGFPIHGLEEYDDDGAWLTPFVIHPTVHKTLYLGVENVWKSTNQGKNWNRLSDFVDDFSLPYDTAKIYALAVAPGNPDYIYASTYDDMAKNDWDVTNRLLCTTNGGTDWNDITPVPNRLITYIAVKDDDPETIWVTFAGFNASGVYELSGPDAVWTDISEGLPEIPVYCIVQNKKNENDDELYVGTYQGVYRKVGKLKWEPYISGLPNVRVNELEIYYAGSLLGTGNKKTLYAATFGRGMWKTELEKADYRLWTGEKDFSWIDKKNWEPEIVPSSNTDVYIPADCPNWPIIPDLIIGADCKNLRMYSESELQVTFSITIYGEHKLICDDLSLLKIGGSWYNENDEAMIDDGYGFLPAPGSEVIFNNQQPAPLEAVSGSETFQNLTIEKTVPGVYYFNPQSNIIVKDSCKIKEGTWKDGADLTHEFYGDFIVEANGILNMNGGSILEFLGSDIQSITFHSFDINNHISTIKVIGTTLLQTTDLTGISRINGKLIIENGIYQVGDLTTQVLDNLAISNGGQLFLDKTTLMINNLHVFPAGIFFSSGIEGDVTQVVKAGSMDYNFTVNGFINSTFTEFNGMNMDGINIMNDGSVASLNNCSFVTPHPNATLLTINNDETISTFDNVFNFNLTQHTVAKTNGEGEVNIFNYSPLNSDDFETDPDGLINWNIEDDKSAFEGKSESSLTLNTNDIIIYPNPSSGSFVIENHLNTSSTKTIKISDMTGRVVYNAKLETRKTTIKTDMYNKGIYILEIKTGVQCITKKIILQ